MQKLFLFLLSCLALNIAQAQPPTITSFSPASGPVGTLVTINGTNLSNPTSITIGGVAAIPISNTGTSLVVMAMPNTTSGRIKFFNSIGLDSTVSIFSVTPSLPPNTQQGNKLVGTGSVGQSNQGGSVAISADGNTVIVGASSDNSFQGAAWIFRKNNGNWNQQGSKLVGTGGVATAYQGYSVAISADGNTVLVGGARDNGSQGATWVFVWNGNIWIEQAKLIGVGNIGAAYQGASVALSADGNIAVIGGYADNNNQGATWVFTRSGTLWTQQAKLIATGNIGPARQGYSVSISADGNTILIGAHYDNSGIGATWVFSRINNVWIQQGSKLVGSGNIGNAYQGNSVSLSADGSTAIVGGFRDNINNSFRGAAWVFVRNGNDYVQQGSKLVGSEGSEDAHQGNSVSISADGNIAIIGGPFDNGQGASWIFKRNVSTWTQHGNKILGLGNVGNAHQGNSVSISADGNTAIIGGNTDNAIVGASWIFSGSSLPTTITSFKAFQKNTGIQVEWQVQNETNLATYEVEKSADGTSFTKAGTVIAIGASTYNWLDANPFNSSNYYRLKMVDKDGSFKYSSIVNVKIGGVKNVFTIAGNPIKNGQLNLQMENVEKGSYTLSIYNNAGQLMMNKTIAHEGGSATQTITLNNVAAGTYQLSIMGNGVKTTKAIVVE